MSNARDESSSPAWASSRPSAATSTASGAACRRRSPAWARSSATSTPSRYRVHIAAEVQDFDPLEDYIDKRR